MLAPRLCEFVVVKSPGLVSASKGCLHKSVGFYYKEKERERRGKTVSLHYVVARLPILLRAIRGHMWAQGVKEALKLSYYCINDICVTTTDNKASPRTCMVLQAGMQRLFSHIRSGLTDLRAHALNSKSIFLSDQCLVCSSRDQDE